MVWGFSFYPVGHPSFSWNHYITCECKILGRSFYLNISFWGEYIQTQTPDTYVGCDGVTISDFGRWQVLGVIAFPFRVEEKALKGRKASHRYPKRASIIFPWVALCFFVYLSEDFMALPWKWKHPMRASPLLVAFVGAENYSVRWPHAVCVSFGAEDRMKIQQNSVKSLVELEKSEIFVLDQVWS